MTYLDDRDPAEGSSGSGDTGRDVLSAGPRWSRPAIALVVSGVVVVVVVLLVGGLTRGHSGPEVAGTRSGADSRPSSSGTSGPRATSTPSRTAVSSPPADRTSLIEGSVVCVLDAGRTGAAISEQIRNQLTDPVTILSVTVRAQRGVTVGATAFGTSHKSCPRVKDLHRPAGYRFRPGAAWVAIHLSKVPRCGDVSTSFVVTYLDHGHRRRFTSDTGTMSINC